MGWRRQVVVVFLPLVAGCALGFGRKSPVLPTDHTVVRDQLVVYSDFDLPERHRLLDALAAQRGDLATKLNLPTSDEPIHVYLFETPNRYQAYINKHYPDFPNRRAFFVENDTQLSVYAHWGDRVAEDLCHEVAHGYLHAVVPTLPLWLDEGLAEYFEVPRGQRGVNREHVELLLPLYNKDRWTPDLPRLEKLASAGEMTQLDYAESWAWAHLLLETTDERLELLQNHLARMRIAGSTGPLSDEIAKTETSAQRELIRHLKSLDQPPVD